MADLFDYLAWRGDLPLDRVPFGPVDGLLVSALAYIRFDGLAPEDFGHGPSLGEAASAFFALPEAERQRRLRNPLDLELLRAMGESARFGPLGSGGGDAVCRPEPAAAQEGRRYRCLPGHGRHPGGLEGGL